MYHRKRIACAGAALALLLTLPAGCGRTGQEAGPARASAAGLTFQDVYVDAVPLSYEETDIAGEAVVLSGAPALDLSLTPTPSGKLTKSNNKAKVDYSNTADGYVMVNFTDSTAARVKVLVMGPNTNTADTRYQYDLPTQQWVTFPLADGSGSYTIKVMEQISDSKYATVADVTFNVSLANEFAPFIRPNQYVNYSDSVSPNAIAKARELAGDEADPLKKVEKIYDFVVKTLSYDSAKAATVQSGYLPVLDTVLAQKKGICFDYAALMAGMLRSQGVPCKLITGWVDNGAYHAWINVWTEQDGWVDGAIYFDGTSWHRMDPTFASSGSQSEAIMKYIGNGSNYKVRWAF